VLQPKSRSHCHSSLLLKLWDGFLSLWFRCRFEYDFWDFFLLASLFFCRCWNWEDSGYVVDRMRERLHRKRRAGIHMRIVYCFAYLQIQPQLLLPHRHLGL
jgi:hypothetical protein